ncbi:Leucine-responsive regulatory protein [Chromobacterium violaceum]|uniref:Leucine-responsive regulatory protein n=1 Tax=Chromobacterium violaceum TaxID=536 RepID=A0A447TBH9_CHRVL|nr:Leucine-responsive regulatory protein [Chromobacterium violaceum]
MKSISASAKALDKMDRKILRILQKNGRIAMTELAEKVGLSTTPAPNG